VTPLTYIAVMPQIMTAEIEARALLRGKIRRTSWHQELLPAERNQGVEENVE
jgi:hypothetical protein